MKIVSPQDGFRYLQDHFPDDIEEFWAVALNAQNEVIAARCLFRGTVDACLFHPRDVFRFACLNNASSVLVAHNHPSGSVEPSNQDLRLTRQLWQAAKWLQIPIADHLIVSKTSYFSFLQMGKLSSRRKSTGLV